MNNHISKKLLIAAVFTLSLAPQACQAHVFSRLFAFFRRPMPMFGFGTAFGLGFNKLSSLKEESAAQQELDKVMKGRTLENIKKVLKYSSIKEYIPGHLEPWKRISISSTEDHDRRKTVLGTFAQDQNNGFFTIRTWEASMNDVLIMSKYGRQNQRNYELESTITKNIMNDPTSPFSFKNNGKLSATQVNEIRDMMDQPELLNKHLEKYAHKKSSLAQRINFNWFNTVNFPNKRFEPCDPESSFESDALRGRFVNNDEESSL